jgi:hypothetical protein
MKINWTYPVFPAYCLTIMFVTAYGGLRMGSLDSLLAAAMMLFCAWTYAYIEGEKAKALPKESYLV